MSTSVCLSVCLSAMISPEPHARSLPIIVLCMLPIYGRGSVLLRQGDEIPRGRDSFVGFSSPVTVHRNVFAAKGIGREWGDGSTQHGPSVIYDCFVCLCVCVSVMLVCSG